MALVRNIVFTVVTTAALIASLLFVLPHNTAAAAGVSLNPGSVTGIDSGTDGLGATTADNFFEFTATVGIAAGEHIPIDFLEVGVGSSGTPIFQGLIAADVCMAPTGPLTPGMGHTEIVSAVGAARTQGPFSGYGYGLDPFGYGPNSPPPSQVDFSGYHSGAGYGYGYDTPGADTLVLTLRVTGCVLPFSPTTHTANVYLQVMLGGDFSQSSSFPPLFVGAPMAADFFDPAFVAPTGPVEDLTIPGTTQTLGDETLVTFGAPTDHNIEAGSTLTLDLSGGGSTAGDLEIHSKAPIPAGAKFILHFHDLGTDPGAADNLDLFNNPPFGLNSLALGAHATVPPIPPAAFFQFQMQVPGASESDLNDFFASVTFTFNVPVVYFTSHGLAIGDVGVLRLNGFDDSTGDFHKDFDPTSDCTTDPTVCTVTYNVDKFSSFALMVGAPRGGGFVGGCCGLPTTPGGGGASEPASTGSGSGTGTSTVGKTVTSTDTSPVKGAPGGGKPGIPGPGLALLAIGLLGAVLVARRKLAK